MLTARVVPRLVKGARGVFSGPVVSGPPRNRVSFAEKMVLGGGMTATFLMYPIWVLVHLQDYKGHD